MCRPGRRASWTSAGARGRGAASAISVPSWCWCAAVIIAVWTIVALFAAWHHAGELRNRGLELLRLRPMTLLFFAQSVREAPVSSLKHQSESLVVGFHRSEVRDGSGLRSAQVRVVGNEFGDICLRCWFDRLETEGLGMRARTRACALLKGPGALLQTR